MHKEAGAGRGCKQFVDLYRTLPGFRHCILRGVLPQNLWRNTIFKHLFMFLANQNNQAFTLENDKILKKIIKPDHYRYK